MQAVVFTGVGNAVDVAVRQDWDRDGLHHQLDGLEVHRVRRALLAGAAVHGDEGNARGLQLPDQVDSAAQIRVHADLGGEWQGGGAGDETRHLARSLDFVQQRRALHSHRPRQLMPRFLESKERNGAGQVPSRRA